MTNNLSNNSVNLIQNNIYDSASSNNFVINNIYCINLESSKERKKNMLKLFNKHNIKPLFITAIHPKTLEYHKVINDLKKVNKLALQLRCFCIDICEHKPRKIRPTEIAISLSHLKTYKQIIDNNDHWALICEDDIQLVQNFNLILQSIIPSDIYNNQEQSIIIHLGGSMDNFGLKIDTPDKFNIHIQPLGSYSNYCYIINNKAAQTLIKHFFPITRPEDSYKRYLILKKKIVSYKVSPSLVGELSAGRNLKPIYSRLSQFRLPSGLINNIPNNYTFSNNITSNITNNKPINTKPKKKNIIRYNKYQ